jgi:Zn-dependent protease
VINRFERNRIIAIVALILGLMFVNYSLEQGVSNAGNMMLELLLVIPAALIAIVFHEVSHGYMAYGLGDPTAKMMGRLTLNPLKHLDPLGVLAIFLIKFGWAKPVPVNYRYLRNPKRDIFLVSMAGPLSNMVIAFVALGLFKGVVMFVGTSNAGLIAWSVMKFLVMTVLINVNFAIFNLLPIPPLDGSKMLMAVLPPRAVYEYERMESTGWIVLLLFLYMGGFEKVLSPLSLSIITWMSGLFGLQF